MQAIRRAWPVWSLGIALLGWSDRAIAAQDHDMPAPSPHVLCEDAIVAAEHGRAMPTNLTLSIARVESGRLDPATGRARPWPWTINAGGVGTFFATKDEAVAAVQALQARGVPVIDVGCMQVNLRHHPKAFANLHEAFDPGTNARYAVRFLGDLHRRTGNWVQATGFYHSQTPGLGDDYVRRVFGPGVKRAGVMQARLLHEPDAASLLDDDDALLDVEPLLARPTLNVWNEGVPGLACPINRC